MAQVDSLEFGIGEIGLLATRFAAQPQAVFEKDFDNLVGCHLTDACRPVNEISKCNRRVAGGLCNQVYDVQV